MKVIAHQTIGINSHWALHRFHQGLDESKTILIIGKDGF